MNQTKRKYLVAYPYIQMIGCQWLIPNLGWGLDS